jgi:hypothetical protein
MRMDWWNIPYGRWRLEAEDQAMRERFPGFELVLIGETFIAWEGRLQSTIAGGDRYLVQVVYTPGYPDIPPRVIIVEPKLKGEVPHLLHGQQPCLYSHGSCARGYDPDSTTAATLVFWTALWIHAYEAWKKTGEWSGKEE